MKTTDQADYLIAKLQGLKPVPRIKKYDAKVEIEWAQPTEQEFHARAARLQRMKDQLAIALKVDK